MKLDVESGLWECEIALCLEGMWDFTSSCLDGPTWYLSGRGEMRKSSLDQEGAHVSF